MIQQINNQSVRFKEKGASDIDYLKSFYNTHKHFPLFQQVLIETRTDCNNHCKFCPHAFCKKPLGIMSWDCYKQIIDQLSDLNYNGRIALMLSNEPLLEERMEDMIIYARQKSPRFFLDMTTNGILLTVEKLDRFFKLGLDNININDYRGDRDRTSPGGAAGERAAAKTVSAVASRRHSSAGPRFCHMDQKASLGG